MKLFMCDRFMQGGKYAFVFANCHPEPMILKGFVLHVNTFSNWEPLAFPYRSNDDSHMVHGTLYHVGILDLITFGREIVTADSLRFFKYKDMIIVTRESAYTDAERLDIYEDGNYAAIAHRYEA